MSKSKNRQQSLIVNNKNRKEKHKLAKKKQTKKRLQCGLIIFAAVVLFGVLPCFLAASDYIRLINRKTFTEMEYISFGSYPQSLVSDKGILSGLNKLKLEWNYFDDCFAGEGFYGTMKQIYTSAEYYRSFWDLFLFAVHKPVQAEAL